MASGDDKQEEEEFEDLLNSEVPRKFSEVPGPVKTEQRKRGRLSTSLFPRHLKLVCRFRIIQ
jgi:hypothetical protein